MPVHLLLAPAALVEKRHQALAVALGNRLPVLGQVMQ